MHACDEGHKVDWEGTKILATILEKSPRSHLDKEDQQKLKSGWWPCQNKTWLPYFEWTPSISFFQSPLSIILYKYITCVFVRVSSIPVYISVYQSCLCTLSPFTWARSMPCIVAVVLLNCMSDVSSGQFRFTDTILIFMWICVSSTKPKIPCLSLPEKPLCAHILTFCIGIGT